LEAEIIGGQPIEQCRNCEGHFASHPALHSLLAAQEGVHRGAGYARPSPLSDPVRYRKCPVCSETMLRRNFAGASGVVIDVCPGHGSWFDRGELATLMEFAATGAWRNAQRATSERLNARKQLDAWMQAIQLNTLEQGVGLGDIARVIPFKDASVEKPKRS
jgi:Zn-finger nucleic acid-binding protein